MESIKKRLQRVKKLLSEYERLSDKCKLSIPPAKLQQLNEKRDAGVIKPSDLPAKLKNEIPKEFQDMTIREIKEMLRRL
jgi:hypothetical protein